MSKSESEGRTAVSSRDRPRGVGEGEVCPPARRRRVPIHVQISYNIALWQIYISETEVNMRGSTHGIHSNELIIDGTSYQPEWRKE